jgi:ATP-binding cassette subfamily B protein
VGELFKKRLLFGCLQLKPEEIRHQGVGQFLGRIMESEAVELLALGGGFAALIALIQLVTAAAVLVVGTKGWIHPLMLLLWTISTLLIGWRYYRASQKWVRSYRQMTNDLVERMVGHQTRLAQEMTEHWHDDEDQILTNYLKLSEGMDRWGISLSAFVSRGWLLLALAGLVPTFILSPTEQAELAITLAGILLAANALRQMANGMTSLVGIMNAWEQFAPLFNFPSKTSQLPSEALLSEQKHVPRGPESAKEGSRALRAGRAVILARDLTFRYHEEGQAVLDQCDLRIEEGERLLLEGPSGGGKSTLAALLSGLRTPDSGLLLLRGLDFSIIGNQEWRRRVVSAPQFHENHVLTESLAFNLLMGRRWPPSASDLEEAEIICFELGLGDLLQRMPAGMQQMVGESGWRLSHGERSRLYIARALLQQADLIILDESFAALDPENLRRALRCVLKRAPSLLVIAHP